MSPADKSVSQRNVLTSEEDQRIARAIRNSQWRFMERIAEHGVLWFCIWNKRRLPEQADEWRSSLLSGIEIQGWIESHLDWFVCGEWDDVRYAVPVRLTEAGRTALRCRDDYDMEPVKGGLVEPGWQALPITAETVGRRSGD